MSEIQKIKYALYKGIEKVRENVDILNKYNEFPVADHDTGINLYLTLEPIYESIEEFENFEKMLNSVSEMLSESSAGNRRNTF